MKAILEFNLPEDKDGFTLATNGINYHCALWDFSQYLRNELKHNDELTHEQLATLEEIDKNFFNILDNFNVNLNEVE